MTIAECAVQLIIDNWPSRNAKRCTADGPLGQAVTPGGWCFKQDNSRGTDSGTYAAAVRLRYRFFVHGRRYSYLLSPIHPERCDMIGLSQNIEYITTFQRLMILWCIILVS